MRIALTGKAGSGKTTIAEYLVKNLGFQRYSFAAALKDIARELFFMDDKNRALLQGIGDKMRDLDVHVWVRYVVTRVEEEGHPDVVIDDLRFKNEELWLKAHNFVIIRLTGRAWDLPEAESQHSSEVELESIQPDYIIDTGEPLEENFAKVQDIIVKEKLRELRMSAEYYRKAREKGNKNYQRGARFEYRCMKVLRDLGWHCMRKFGSHDDIWKIGGRELHVPVDITAYKNGVYMVISCKYSINHATTYLDDPKRDNLVEYCKLFDAIPVFAGVNERRRAYFVDLRILEPLDPGVVGTPSYINATRMVARQVTETQMDKLMSFTWWLLENVLKKQYDKAINRKDTGEAARWAGEMVKLVNIINRQLQSAGDTATEEDLTELLKRMAEEGEP